MEDIKDNASCILIYRPNSIIPEIMKVNDKELFKIVKNICHGYESVSIAKLHHIYQGAVFICSDDFSKLSDQRVNLVGTYLYGYSLIMGTVCIVKAERDKYGDIIHIGFSESIANHISNKIIKQITEREVCNYGDK